MESMKFVDVVLPLPLSSVFTYALPEGLQDAAGVGCRVVVPFGAKKIYTGIVTEVHGRRPEGYEVKGVISEIAGNSNTTHPAIVNFKGKWLFISHNGGLPTGTSYSRSIVAEPLEYNADGTITNIPPTAEGVKPM